MRSTYFSLAAKLLITLILFASVGVVADDFSMKKLLKSKWVVAESDNFVILTDLKPKYARQLAIDLEEFRYFVFFKMHQEPLSGTGKLRIVAPSKDTSMKATGIESNLAGFFLTGEAATFALANVIGYKGKSSEIQSNIDTLLHEYVHFAMERSLSPKNYPLWYSEGLAEYLATYRKYKNEVRLGEPDRFVDLFYSLLPQGSVKKHFTAGSVGASYRLKGIDSEELFNARSYSAKLKKDASKKEKDRNSYLGLRFYARSIAVTHFLLATNEKAQALKVYFGYLNMGVPAGAAFHSAFGFTFDELDQQVESYINGNSVLGWTYKIGEKLTFPEFKVSVDELKKGAIDDKFLPLLAHLNASNDEANYDELLAYISQSKSKESVLTKHLINEDTLLDFTHVDHETALENLVKDQHAFPDYPDLAALLASVYMKRARLRSAILGQQQTADYNKARTLFVKALKADPYNAMSYAGLGELALMSEPHSKDYQQGIVAFDSLEVLLVQSLVAKYNLKKARLSVKNEDLHSALLAMRKFNQLSKSGYAKNYGKFVYEGLELWGACQEKPQLNKNILFWRNGSQYKGNIANGLPEGKGVFTHIQGFTAEGKWEQGKLVSGVLKTTNGFEYSGEFTDCAVSGEGRLTYPEKNKRYESSKGNYVAGWEHGLMTFKHRNGAVEIGEYYFEDPRGEFLVNLPRGRSLSLEAVSLGYRMKLENGDFWVGGLDKKFRPNGSGYCLNDGKISTCEFDHGEKSL